MSMSMTALSSAGKHSRIWPDCTGAIVWPSADSSSGSTAVACSSYGRSNAAHGK